MATLNSDEFTSRPFSSGLDNRFTRRPSAPSYTPKRSSPDVVVAWNAIETDLSLEYNSWRQTYTFSDASHFPNDHCSHTSVDNETMIRMNFHNDCLLRVDRVLRGKAISWRWQGGDEGVPSWLQQAWAAGWRVRHCHKKLLVGAGYPNP
jgi:hypothetical protein